DPVEPRIAEAPAVTGPLVNATAHLSWQAPDDGGAAITAYKIYRRIGTSGNFTLLATVNGNSYDDTVNPNEENFYHVTAVNSEGEGPYCGDFKPGAPPRNACVA